MLVHAEPDARAVRHIRRALAFEVGQQQQAARARRDARRLRGELLVRPAEVLAHHLGGDGDVHRAEQRQPAVGGVAEGGDLALRIDDRLFGAGVDGAAGAEAGGDDARARVAGADGAHHVVAAAGADEHAGAQVEQLGRGGLQRAGGLVAAHQRRQLAGQFGINRVAGRRSDHLRLRTSSKAVPLASPYSIVFSPVSQKFR